MTLDAGSVLERERSEAGVAYCYTNPAGNEGLPLMSTNETTKSSRPRRAGRATGQARSRPSRTRGNRPDSCRALRALSRCNQALVRATAEDEFMWEVCRILVNMTGYSLAEVAFISDARPGLLRRVAWAARGSEGAAAEEDSPDDEQAESGPADRAVRTGWPCVVRHVQSDPRCVHLRDQADRFGYRSLLALPLIHGGRTFGALTVCAREPEAFGREETELLRELAGDLAYGIAAFRMRAERERAERALRESDDRYHQLFENLNDAAFLIDPQSGIILDTNRQGERLLGRPREQIAGMTQEELYPPDRARARGRLLQDCLRGRKPGRRFDLEVARADGTVVPVVVSASWVTIGGQPFLVALFQDVTHRRRAEEQLRRTCQKLRKATEAAVEAIALTVESRDPHTAGHQRRVSRLSCAIARELGLPEDRIDGIRLASLVHDLGKIHVPGELLTKPGRLTPPELEIIKGHARVGYDILKEIDFPWPVAQMVLQHHERMNGSGYPEGLSGDQILLEARIIAVADVIEAMAFHRPYRPGQGLKRALEEITRNRAVLYDPQVVDACVRLFAEKRFKFERTAPQGFLTSELASFTLVTA